MIPRVVPRSTADFNNDTNSLRCAPATHAVSLDEVAMIRAELSSIFSSAEVNYLSTDYILSVASKPYSKDPYSRRPIAYTIEKLTILLSWRKDSEAAEVFDLVDVSRMSIEDMKQTGAKYEKSINLVNTLNNHSIYLHGYDKERRPIVWLRTERKPWLLADVDAEIKLHILLVDSAIKAMPEGVTDFVVVADTTSVPPPSPMFLHAILQGLIRGYPDRLHRMYVAPLGRVLHSTTQLMMPLMPKSYADKLEFHEEKSTMYPVLKSILWKGDEDVPDFFGGEADHDKYYPNSGVGRAVDQAGLGEGCLMFDYAGMLERQKVMMALTTRENNEKEE